MHTALGLVLASSRGTAPRAVPFVNRASVFRRSLRITILMSSSTLSGEEDATGLTLPKRQEVHRESSVVEDIERCWRSYRPSVGVVTFSLQAGVPGGEGETVETPCVACRCVVLPNLQRCVLLTTYGGPPATPPGPLPPLRVTSPDCPTRSYPHRHTVYHCQDIITPCR